MENDGYIIVLVMKKVITPILAGNGKSPMKQESSHTSELVFRE